MNIYEAIYRRLKCNYDAYQTKRKSDKYKRWFEAYFTDNGIDKYSAKMARELAEEIDKRAEHAYNQSNIPTPKKQKNKL